MHATTRIRALVLAIACALTFTIFAPACGTKPKPAAPDGGIDPATLGDTIIDEAEEPTGENRPPIVDAGPNHLASPGDRVTLDGSASFDPDDDPLSFEWRQTGGALVDLEGADSSVASFVVPLLEDGDSLSFTLAVSDGLSRVVAGVLVAVSTTRVCEFSARLDENQNPDAPLEGQRPFHVTFDAAVVSGEAVDGAEFVWTVDGEEAREPVADHEGMSHSFTKGGLHTVLLTLAMGELNVACVNTRTGIQSEDVRVQPTISGRVVDLDGAPIPGATVSANAGGSTSVSNGAGNYSVRVPYHWTGSVTAQHADYHFSPSEYRYSQLSVDKQRDFHAGAGDGDENPAGCEVDADCADDLFCNGVESCADGLCRAGTDPCPGELCDELADECYVTQQSVDCAVDAECDDGADCTQDTCQGGLCVFTPDDANCDDGLFCNGDERCLGGACVAGEPPCPLAECNESTDSCGVPIECDDDQDCDDGIACTQDACNLAINRCANGPLDLFCDNGQFCDGAEVCDPFTGDPSTGCRPGDAPCSVGETCNEESNSCDPPPACSNNADCDDGVACTVDTCNTDAGTCVFTPDNGACDDGLFCNGAETCDPVGGNPNTGCKAGNDPCPGEECNENTNTCVECLNNADCNDNNPCTNDTCASGTCQNVNNTNSCNDNNDCTENDACSGGECTGDPIEGCESGNTYYVDDDAPAGGDGTQGRPFKTIQAAANVLGQGDTVYVMEGIYHEQVQITANGTADNRITIKAFGTDTVIIDGQKPNGGNFYYGLLVGRSNAESGHYVTVEGFRIRHTLTSGVAFANNIGGVIRNNHVHDNTNSGINVQGRIRDTTVEYNHVHNNYINIRVTQAADYPEDRPENITVRWNHVHHTDRGDPDSADGIVMRGALNCILEHNVMHHNIEDGFDDYHSDGTVVRYNIVYLSNPNDLPESDGNGMKFGVGAGGNKLIHNNIAFLNRQMGLEVNVAPGYLGARVFNNTVYQNGRAGLSVSNPASGLTPSIVKNNIGADNPLCDVCYSGDEDAFDYNYNPEQGNPHGLFGDPGLADLQLLTVDANGDGTPDVLDALNDPSAFPDTESAIIYAKQKMAEIFGLERTSRAIDAGLDVGLDLVDLLGNGPIDDPETQNPWGGPGTGLYDMGAIEYYPTP